MHITAVGFCYYNYTHQGVDVIAVAVMVAVTVTTLKHATFTLNKSFKEWTGICMSFFISNRNKYRVYTDNLK